MCVTPEQRLRTPFSSDPRRVEDHKTVKNDALSILSTPGPQLCKRHAQLRLCPPGAGGAAAATATAAAARVAPRLAASLPVTATGGLVQARARRLACREQCVVGGGPPR